MTFEELEKLMISLLHHSESKKIEDIAERSSIILSLHDDPATYQMLSKVPSKVNPGEFTDCTIPGHILEQIRKFLEDWEKTQKTS